MSEWELIGGVVVVLGILATLFVTFSKPLNNNTKMLTEISMKVNQINENLEEQKNDFAGYKQHVSLSQQKQWDVINEHSDILLRHDIEIKQLKEVKEA